MTGSLEADGLQLLLLQACKGAHINLLHIPAFLAYYMMMVLQAAKLIMADAAFQLQLVYYLQIT